MKPPRNDDLPKATHEGVAEILGIKVRMYRVDDGRAVIHSDDFHKLLKVLGFDPSELPSAVLTTGQRT